VSKLRNPSWRELKPLLLLSVIVPIGFLVTFRLSGIVGEPAVITEVLQLKNVKWKCERPYLWSRVPNPTANVTFSNDEVAFNWDLGLSSYDPEWFGSEKTIFIGIADLSFSVQHGFVHTVQVNYREDYPMSSVTIWRNCLDLNETYFARYDLKIDKIVDSQENWQLLENNTKASINMVGLGKPDRVFVKNGSVLYRLRSPYNYTHQLEISSRIIYFNGTIYKELVQDIQFIFGPDHNNSFDEAEEIDFGTHEAYLDESGGDPVDYYKIWLEQWQTVKVALAYTGGYDQYNPELGIETRVYDPNRKLVAILPYPQHEVREMIIHADSTGWWYIRTNLYVAPYVYVLNLSLMEG